MQRQDTTLYIFYINIYKGLTLCLDVALDSARCSSLTSPCGFGVELGFGLGLEL